MQRRLDRLVELEDRLLQWTLAAREELQEAMEFRSCEDQALVLRGGAFFLLFSNLFYFILFYFLFLLWDVKTFSFQTRCLKLRASCEASSSAVCCNMGGVCEGSAPRSSLRRTWIAMWSSKVRCNLWSGALWCIAVERWPAGPAEDVLWRSMEDISSYISSSIPFL